MLYTPHLWLYAKMYTSLSHSKCYKNMLQAIKTDKALRIEFDESVVCDICRDVSAVTVATIHTHRLDLLNQTRHEFGFLSIID